MSARGGMTAAEAAKLVAPGLWTASASINAYCDKCAASLRASEALMVPVRAGYVDHAGCGGTFRALASEAVEVHLTHDANLSPAGAHTVAEAVRVIKNHLDGSEPS